MAVIFVAAVLLLVSKHLTRTTETEPPLPQYMTPPWWFNVQRGPKILYIVTSAADIDSGQRNTVLGRDRFRQVLIPVLSDGVESILGFGFQVDVYLITHYIMGQDKRDLLRRELPRGVGIEIWDDATPLGYKVDVGENGEATDAQKIQAIHNALSRQHRLVIKDKLFYYDLFVSFEDDMYINGHIVRHYLQMTEELQRLKKLAPMKQSTSTLSANDPQQQPLMAPLDQYYGNLTKIQLARMVPGFIRVESIVKPQEFWEGRKERPISLHRNNIRKWNIPISAVPCCQRSCKMLADHTIPDHYPEHVYKPQIKDLYLWETQTIALGLHKMPEASTLDWIILQRGVDQQYLPREKMIGEYWTGTNFTSIKPLERPNPTHPKYINNQGGWMGTSYQIFAWHRGHCKGQLLPPFDDMDGLKSNVEYWSGGLSLVGMNTCQLQRIVSLNPRDFAKHLVYHTTNNKQMSKNLAFTNVQDFWEEMYSVQLEAEASIPDLAF